MPKVHAITSRAVIASAGATVVTAALAALYVNAAHPGGADDERLHQLMAEWRAAYDAANDGTHPEDLPDPLIGKVYAIEREAAAIRPATLQGLAIKLLLLTNYGEFDLDDFRAGLLAEAEAITGYAPPTTFKRS